jgi:NADH dehydrogenase
MMATKRQIVIIGGGFGGLNVAKGLKGVDADITLIDKSNHHLFQPLLYQVATASLSPGDIAVPIRSVVSKNKSVRCIMGEVVSIDKEQKLVSLKSGVVYPYDQLVIATGSRHSYFGNDQWEKYAPGLKTLHDALKIREKILLAFEKAEVTDDEAVKKACLTFVIVGGGPTGVEMAGAIAEISLQTLKDDYRKIDPQEAKIIIVEGSPRVLNKYPEELCQEAKRSLESLGVEIRLNSVVTDIQEGKVKVGDEWIDAFTIIWAAGNTAPAFLKTLEVPLEKTGQIAVNGDLSIPDFPDIFVIGDSAKVMDKHNNPLPGIAPVAMQQGKFLAKILRRPVWKHGRPTFHYFDKGTMATIGRASAVANIFSLKFTGTFAWILWSLVHIMFLINFRSKVLVMLNWMWMHARSFRGARILTSSSNDSTTLNG